MAAVEVTISGILYDKNSRVGTPVTLVGEAILSNVGVGGGPVYPPGNGGQPPSIWPSPGHPAHPIAPGGLPPHPAHPIAPGGPPAGIWPGPGPLPHPEHPIALPPAPEEPIEPPVEWKAVWHPEAGWIVVGVPTVPHPAPGE